MVQESFQVSTYQYYNWSSRKPSAEKTNILLRGASGEVCVVYFREDGTADIPKAKKEGDNNYKFYYHHSQLPHLIDMLRYEKPIYVFFNDDGGLNNSRISTTPEPVGEGEES